MTVPAEPVYLFPHTGPEVGSGQEFKGFSSSRVSGGGGFVVLLDQVKFQGHEVRDVDPSLIS